MEELIAHDEEFYIDNADCVIRVENTLFKVHRFFLGRDSSAFQHMFHMPLSNHVEGCSDENPIRLFGESVKRFRALLSVIYHLPLQLQAYHTPAGDVEQLLTIVEMTNKYQFASIEKWAIEALFNVLSGLHGPPQALYALESCSSVWMKRLAETALLCGHIELLDYIAGHWVDRIVALDLRPIHALEIAETAGIRRLLGYAYYFQLGEMDDAFEPGVVEDGRQYSSSATVAGGNGGNATLLNSARTGTPASLTCEQRKRLLMGHWSLSRLWDRLRLNPPGFPQSEGCANHHRCLSTWKGVWNDLGMVEATLKVPAWNVPARLRAMEQNLFMSADLVSLLFHGLTPECKRSAVQAFKAMIKEVKEGLADHFADKSLTAKAQSPTPSISEA